MSQRVRVRRLTDEEGAKLQRLVRKGEGKGQADVVRYRRAMVVLGSAGGNTVEVLARLVQTSPDRVREMIHRFNELGMASLHPTPTATTAWAVRPPLAGCHWGSA